MPADTWDRLFASHEAASKGAGDLRHQPTAAILACSDARVPPSVVFDQPAGSLFVIRLAGNTASPAASASLNYAVETLGVDTIIVMGHTHCGAVEAAVAGTCGGHLEPIVGPICELAAAHPDAPPDEIAVHNVARTVRDLRADAGPIGNAYDSGQLTILGAIHDLDTGCLEPVPVPDEQSVRPVHPVDSFHTVSRNPDALEASP